MDDDPQTRAIFEEILRDEVFHMNYTYTQLARVLPQSYRRQVWLARASRLWKRYLRVAAAIASVLGAAVLTIIYFILLPPFAWLAKRAERREPPGWTPIPRDARRVADESVLNEDPRDLRPLSRFGGRAPRRRRAGLRRAGRAAVAAQERRDVSGGRDRVVPGSRRARAGRSRRGRLLRAQHAEVRADPHLRAPRLPAFVAIVSARDEELARREGLGARHHLVAPRRAGAQDPVHAAPRIARGGRLPDGADAARGDPHRRRRRRMGHAHGRSRRAARRTAAPTSRCSAKSGSRIRSGCCIRRSRRISASRSTRTSTR